MRRFLPKDPINVTTTATSTAFQLVNDSSGPKEYVFVASQTTHVKRGYSDVDEATTDDMRLPLNVAVFLTLMPGEGVRAIRATSDGVLQIGDVSK